MADDYVFEVDEPLFLKINNWHAGHPGELLTLSGAEIAELAGCACHGNEERHDRHPAAHDAHPGPHW